MLPLESIISKIYDIRGLKVMLDRDLAVLYEVETKALNQAVKRNISRFPEDFMFQLSTEEVHRLRSQFVTANISVKSREFPYVFTENGIAMLSSVLKSEKAIEINILIMRVFTKLRNRLASNEELRQKVNELERKQVKTDEDIVMLISAVNMLLEPQPEPSTKRIGFYKE